MSESTVQLNAQLNSQLNLTQENGMVNMSSTEKTDNKDNKNDKEKTDNTDDETNKKIFYSNCASLTFGDLYNFYEYVKSINELKQYDGQLLKVLNIVLRFKPVELYNLPKHCETDEETMMHVRNAELIEAIETFSDSDVTNILFTLTNVQNLSNYSKYSKYCNSDNKNMIKLLTDLTEEEKLNFASFLISMKNEYCSLKNKKNKHEQHDQHDDTIFGTVKRGIYTLGTIPIALVGGFAGAIAGATGGAFVASKMYYKSINK